MQTSNKQTPKSCSCEQCKHAKRTAVGHFFKRMGDRTLRAQWRNQRYNEDPVLAAAPSTAPIG